SPASPGPVERSSWTTAKNHSKTISKLGSCDRNQTFFLNEIVRRRGAIPRLELFPSVLESYFPSHGEPPVSEKAPRTYMPRVPLFSSGSLRNPTPPPFPSLAAKFSHRAPWVRASFDSG